MKMRDYFYVERATWRRGEEHDNCLLDDKGNRCCLGFFCAQMGVPDEYLRNQPLPDDAAEAGGYDIPYLMVREAGVPFPFVGPSDLACNAAEINDNVAIDDTERERRLTELFAEHGIEVEFV